MLAHQRRTDTAHGGGGHTVGFEGTVDLENIDFRTYIVCEFCDKAVFERIAKERREVLRVYLQ